MQLVNRAGMEMVEERKVVHQEFRPLPLEKKRQDVLLSGTWHGTCG